MTNEQREAIEFLEFYKQHCLKKEIENMDNYETIHDGDFVSKNLDTVLSLIKEQEEKIEGLKNKEVLIKRYFKKCDLIKQKDKQIDLMAEELWREFYLTYMNGYGINSKEELKQYFERKVEQ